MSLFEEFFRQRSDLSEASKTPRTVIFSNAGWMRAMKEEHDAGRDHNITTGPSATYCGLHRAIDDRHDAPEVVVTDLTQAEYFAPRQPYRRQDAITVKIDGIMSGAPVVEIIAANLKASQLCDIIRAWLDSDDATHWGEFEKALDRVVVEHGRFE